MDIAYQEEIKSKAEKEKKIIKAMSEHKPMSKQERKEEAEKLRRGLEQQAAYMKANEETRKQKEERIKKILKNLEGNRKEAVNRVVRKKFSEDEIEERRIDVLRELAERRKAKGGSSDGMDGVNAPIPNPAASAGQNIDIREDPSRPSDSEDELVAYEKELLAKVTEAERETE